MDTVTMQESNTQFTTDSKQGTSADRWRQVLVVVAVVSTIAINALANILPINGMDTGELSDRYEIYITPAGYVFSIWGLIYTGLVAFAIFQALPSQRTNPRLRSIGTPFLVSSIANISWILAWHYQIVPLSLAIMLVILGSLIAIYLRLRPEFKLVSVAEQWTTHIPFSVYLGWITVATIVNVTVIFDYFGWGGGGLSPEIWTAIMLGVATIVGLIMTQVRRDIAYGLVLVWAFAGIAAKHMGVPIVAGAAIATALVMAISILLTARKAQSLLQSRAS